MCYHLAIVYYFDEVLFMDIAFRLKALREEKDISVYKLAQLSEVSSTYSHEIESGKKQPTMLILEKLCNALDITMYQFFEPEDTSEKYPPDVAILADIAQWLPTKYVDALIVLAKHFKVMFQNEESQN